MLLLALAAGCTRAPAADPAKVRAVMEEFLQAQREHRGSHGNFWRDSQAKVDRDAAIKNLGVDLSEAGDVRFTLEPREDGADTILRVTAVAAGGAKLTCVQKGQEPKADCKESTGSS
jgi:hypothetical protein